MLRANHLSDIVLRMLRAFAEAGAFGGERCSISRAYRANFYPLNILNILTFSLQHVGSRALTKFKASKQPLTRCDMRPDQLSKGGSEHAHQVALFAYIAVARLHGFAAADAWADGAELPTREPEAEPVIPALKWFHAIPNGGARGNARDAAIRGANLKAEGVRAGVADTFLPVPRNGWHGLYVEMKKPSLRPKRGGAGGVSDEQFEFCTYAREAGYGWCVCYDWRQAADVIQQYMGDWHRVPRRTVDNTQ